MFWYIAGARPVIKRKQVTATESNVAIVSEGGKWTMSTIKRKPPLRMKQK